MSFDKERRTAGGRRIPIKTLVEIGAGEGGSAAFEAESIDVTTSGMHLRTAYLPEIGEPLACRFEAGGKEVVVQGAVALPDHRRRVANSVISGTPASALESGQSCFAAWAIC